MKDRLLTWLALFAFAVAPVSLFAQAAQTPQASQGTCSPTPCTPGGGLTGKLMADISPYGGYVWPKSFSGIGAFKGSQILGVRGGFFVTPDFEIGGNYNWNSHFQPRNANLDSNFAGNLGFPQGSVRANVWEAEFTYHFGAHRFAGSSVRPYLVAGGGGLTTKIKNQDLFVLNTRSFFVPAATPADLQFNLQNNNLQNVLPGIDTTNGVAFVGTPTGTNVFVPNDVFSGETFFTFSYGGGLKAARLWGPMGVFGDIRGRTLPNLFGHGNTWPELSAGLNFAWGEK
jgi:hypothetical protein